MPRGRAATADASSESSYGDDMSDGGAPTLTARQLAAHAAKSATAAATPAPEAPERRSAKGEAEPPPDGESCYECMRKAAGRGDAIIFCESCEYGYHQKCHGGPLLFVVPGEKDTWFCAWQAPPLSPPTPFFLHPFPTPPPPAAPGSRTRVLHLPCLHPGGQWHTRQTWQYHTC